MILAKMLRVVVRCNLLADSYTGEFQSFFFVSKKMPLYIISFRISSNDSKTYLIVVKINFQTFLSLKLVFVTFLVIRYL